ncbi:hypothetical protein [uncultured Arcticibacterium sp.]|uniref:hypothetical protein n=1 Tax=uncultured Arcticibacterium sp. TaxID=2173042 RepID=UPI0030F55464
MKRTFKYYVLLISGILPLGCFGQKKLTLENYRSFVPPNMIQVNDTLFCDQVEMSNIDWLLYDYNTKEVNGDSSKQYNSLKLDWDGVIGLEKDYLRYPGYRDFPLISVSLDQAKGFADWRTETLFSYILKELKLVSEDFFKKGESTSINEIFKSHPELKDKLYYFEFRIPTEKEWRVSLKYADDIDGRYKKKNRHILAENYNLEGSTIENGLSNVFIGYQVTRNRNPILKMNDNVSEIILEEGYSMGGNYYEKEPESIKNKFEGPNAWTGFRCVGSWKKWGE